MLRRALRLLLVLGLTAAPLRAQGAPGAIRGVLWDSLVTQRPIAGALSVVDGLPMRARTDDRGRFVLDSVPTGTWIVRYAAPWLDSLSLAPLVAQVEVRGTRTARTRLGTPSPSRYFQAICGAPDDLNRGVLLGRLVTADGLRVAGMFVGALWAEAVLRTDGMQGQLVGTVDTSSSEGMFALCGVPRETTVLVRAGEDSLGTGALVLGLTGRVALRRDLVVGPPRPGARVSGRVRAERGRVAGVITVDVPSDSGRAVRADSTGSFVVGDVPRRTAQLFVRAIGFTPQYVLVEPIAGNLELEELVLPPVPQELAEFRIVAAMETLAQLEFTQRRRSGRGVFLDETEIARYPMLSANILASLSLRIRSSGGGRPVTLLRGATGICRPRWFVDGVDWRRPQDYFEEVDLLQRAKRMEIYDQYDMPAKYYDVDQCGVVLIWTR